MRRFRSPFSTANIDQVFIPAEPHYFKLYADLKRETMRL